MTNSMKYFLAACVGAGIGGVATWLLLRQHYEAIAEQDAQEVRDWARQHIAQAEKRAEETREGDVAGTDDEPEAAPTSGGRTLYNRVKPDLAVLAQQAHVSTTVDAPAKPRRDETEDGPQLIPERDDRGEDEEEDKPMYEKTAEEVMLEAQQEVTLGEGGEPFLISEQEFSYNGPGALGYQKEQLTYYAKDDVLADEDDTVMDVKSICGYDILDQLDGDVTTVIFVRNPDLEIDYEIEWENKSYAEYVLGEDPGVLQQFRRRDREE